MGIRRACCDDYQSLYLGYAGISPKPMKYRKEPRVDGSLLSRDLGLHPNFPEWNESAKRVKPRVLRPVVHDVRVQASISDLKIREGSEE